MVQLALLIRKPTAVVRRQESLPPVLKAFVEHSDHAIGDVNVDDRVEIKARIAVLSNVNRFLFQLIIEGVLQNETSFFDYGLHFPHRGVEEL